MSSRGRRWLLDVQAQQRLDRLQALASSGSGSSSNPVASAGNGSSGALSTDDGGEDDSIVSAFSVLMKACMTKDAPLQAAQVFDQMLLSGYAPTYVPSMCALLGNLTFEAYYLSHWSSRNELCSHTCDRAAMSLNSRAVLFALLSCPSLPLSPAIALRAFQCVPEAGLVLDTIRLCRWLLAHRNYRVDAASSSEGDARASSGVSKPRSSGAAAAATVASSSPSFDELKWEDAMDGEGFPGSAVHDLGGISDVMAADIRNPEWDRVTVAAVRAYV